MEGRATFSEGTIKENIDSLAQHRKITFLFYDSKLCVCG